MTLQAKYNKLENDCFNLLTVDPNPPHDLNHFSLILRLENTASPEGHGRGAAAKVINWMNAMTQVTVPKLAIIMRKSYGQAYINMAGGRNADEVALWPTADLGFMDPQVGAHVLEAGKQDDARRRDATIDRISQDTGAWDLAELYEAQTVLDPRETRHYLIRTLEVHRQRLNGGLSEHRLSNWPTGF